MLSEPTTPPASIATPPTVEPPRDRVFLTFLALGVISLAVRVLVRLQPTDAYFAVMVCVSALLALAAFVFVVWQAQADQDEYRAERSGLDKLAVVLMLLIPLVMLVPVWFAARQIARQPRLRNTIWGVALVLLVPTVMVLVINLRAA